MDINLIFYFNAFQNRRDWKTIITGQRGLKKQFKISLLGLFDQQRYKVVWCYRYCKIRSQPGDPLCRPRCSGKIFYSFTLCMFTFYPNNNQPNKCSKIVYLYFCLISDPFRVIELSVPGSHLQLWLLEAVVNLFLCR